MSNHPEFLGLYIKGSRMSEKSFNKSKTLRFGKTPDLDLSIPVISNVDNLMSKVKESVQRYTDTLDVKVDFFYINFEKITLSNVKDNVLKSMVSIASKPLSNEDHLI